MQRRNFLRTALITGGTLMAGHTATAQSQWQHGQWITLPALPEAGYFQPLDTLPITLTLKRLPAKARLEVLDGDGNAYARLAPAESLALTVGGALGTHHLRLLDRGDRLLDEAFFPVRTQTGIEDEGGEFQAILDMLRWSMSRSSYALGKIVRYNHKTYKYYSSWFQDHVFVAMAAKYYDLDLQTGIDLYADGQREDGLIWDNYKHPYPGVQSFWQQRFDYGGFTYVPEDPMSTALFVKVPVENLGEHTFLEGLYDAWIATGDDEWMASRLDHALKAVHYATSSPWAWSEQFQLPRRPYTIDRWDYHADQDRALIGGDIMGADLDITPYGMMYGDSLCLYNGCLLLAKMLRHASREAEAQEMEALAAALKARTDELAWNGRFYTHFIPENPERTYDFGDTPTDEQVTLSSALVLNRSLEQEKAASIIQTYQRIQNEMPESSPGEWYCCYPPFEKGFAPAPKWTYMNGGVSPIVGGELARGAFEHGFEAYGVDILRRTQALAAKTDGALQGCYRGKMPERPNRTFQPLDLREVANTDTHAQGFDTDHPWPDAKADFQNLPKGEYKVEDVPFDLIDPARNDRKAVVMVGPEHFPEGKLSVAVNKKAGSIYLLHAATASIAGQLIWTYEDGEQVVEYLTQEAGHVDHWWFPDMERPRKGYPKAVIGWRGPSNKVKDVGCYALGLDNPHPEKVVRQLSFHNPVKGTSWAVFGVTLCDQAHFFMPSIVSTIPQHWAAAHVLLAMMEGLAGLQSAEPAFKQAVLKPRWAAAGVSACTATAHFPASDGYLRYRYEQSPGGAKILVTGSSETIDASILLPQGITSCRAKVDGKPLGITFQAVEQSTYAVLPLEGPGPHALELDWG